jgi:dihydroflavonol-4-reductase
MIFVTGGTGFIGSYLLYYLLQKNTSVRALKRPSSSARYTQYIFKHLSELEPLPDGEKWSDAFGRIEWVEGDVLDITSILEHLGNIDIVYHAAGMVSYSQKKREAIINTNVNGTINIVNACLEKGISKLRYLSSVAALARKTGSMADEVPKPEDLKFSNPYSESKYRAEMEVWRGMAEGLEVVIINPGIVLGWGDFSAGSPEMFRTVFKGLKFYPTGSNAFVDARDVAKTLIQLSDNENAVNNRFIIAGDTVSYKIIFDLMANGFGLKGPAVKVPGSMIFMVWLFAEMKALITGGDPFVTRDMALTSSQDYGYDNSKVKKLLGYRFLPVEKTIADTCRIYLSEKII